MNIDIKKQVCARAQGETLCRLGVIPRSVFYHYYSPVYTGDTWAVGTESDARALHVYTASAKTEINLWVCAYNTAELGAMLQNQTMKCYCIKSGGWKHVNSLFQAHNISQAECYACRLIYLMMKNHLKWTPYFVNNRLQNFF